MGLDSRNEDKINAGLIPLTLC